MRRVVVVGGCGRVVGCEEVGGDCGMGLARGVPEVVGLIWEGRLSELAFREGKGFCGRGGAEAVRLTSRGVRSGSVDNIFPDATAGSAVCLLSVQWLGWPCMVGIIACNVLRYDRVFS